MPGQHSRHAALRQGRERALAAAGQCAALRAGLEAARYPLVCYGTADKRDRAADLDLLLKEIDKVDLVSGYRAFVHPQLNDVSTDLAAPPMLVAAVISRSPDMNKIAAFTPEQRKLQTEHYPEVTGRRYEMPLDRVAEIVEMMLRRQGWTIATSRPAFVGQSEMTIEALAHTPLLRFPVDVAVRLTDEGTSTYVDMRSSSRYGRHDLGDNAARITTFLAELDAEMATQAGAAPAE